MGYNRWLAQTCIIIFVGMAGSVLLVVTVDPFFHYHAPLRRFPYQIDNQLSQNPGMARHMEYDSVLLGSSMTVNFETDWFAQKMGLQVLKLSYNGAYPKDISNIMERVDLRDGELRQVFLGVDLALYTGGINETRYPVPDYLYNTSLADDVQYLFNKGVLLDYILKPLIEQEPTALSSVYASEEFLRECYGPDYVLANYTIPEKNDAWFPEDMFIEDLEANLQVNILPVIESHPETQFVVFFPPYSVLYWYEYVQNNQLDAVMYEYQYFMEKLLVYDNVELYFFPGIEEIVCDLGFYADSMHYNQSVNRFMTLCFANEMCRISEENYKEELQRMKSMIETYDYDALFAAGGR